ncbi:uncharacterized protein LOC144338149 [Macaca mulatta]
MTRSSAICMRRRGWGGAGGDRRAEDAEEAESLGAFGGAVPGRLSQGDREPWLDAAAAAAALPGPTSLAFLLPVTQETEALNDRGNKHLPWIKMFLAVVQL